MNWFLRLKLANKLLLTFMMCSVLTAAVGVYGMIRLADIGRMLTQTYTASVLPAQLVSQAAGLLTSHSRSYVRLPALKDPNEVKQAVARGKVNIDKYRQTLDAYRKTDLSDSSTTSCRTTWPATTRWRNWLPPASWRKPPS